MLECQSRPFRTREAANLENVLEFLTKSSFLIETIVLSIIYSHSRVYKLYGYARRPIPESGRFEDEGTK